jgi:hypothetical protein
MRMRLRPAGNRLWAISRTAGASAGAIAPAVAESNPLATNLAAIESSVLSPVLLQSDSIESKNDRYILSKVIRNLAIEQADEDYRPPTGN